MFLQAHSPFFTCRYVDVVRLC